MGVSLNNLGRVDEAVTSYRQVIILEPRFAEAHNNLGNALKILGSFDEAVLSFRKAIELQPSYAEAYYNLGLSFQELNQLAEAEASYRQAITIKCDHVEAHTNLGLILHENGSMEKSEASYREAIGLRPDYLIAHQNLGALLWEQKRLDEALVCYEHAFNIDPHLDYLSGYITQLKQALCEWDTLPQHLDELTARINKDQPGVMPYELHSLIDSPSIHQKCSEIVANNRFPQSNVLPEIKPYEGHEKIRIGYFSPDFYTHPVATGVADLFKYHDRAKFEVHAFSFGRDIKDDWNIRVRQGVDHYHDVRTMSDKDIALLSRSLEIDIAVDLTGYTKGSRTDIFAMSAAPIQLVYLGYLGTMGSSYYDYIISDSIMIPEDSKSYYAENIVYLPSYQVNSNQVAPIDPSFDRRYFGLPEDAFVFCCFNNTFKLTPAVFDSWARILSRVTDSVLMLCVSNDRSINNIKQQMDSRGIDPSRLIFSGRLGGSQYWSRYQVVDLVLDTFTCSGGATSSDALRVGCPVLTCMGDSSSSRFGGSILTALGLPELVTTTAGDYEELAVHLAAHPEELKALKEKLVANIATERLYDTQRFTHSIEAAYSQMHDRSQKGMSPDDIYTN